MTSELERGFSGRSGAPGRGLALDLDSDLLAAEGDAVDEAPAGGDAAAGGAAAPAPIEELSGRVAALEVADAVLAKRLSDAADEAKGAIKLLADKQTELRKELVNSDALLARDAESASAELRNRIAGLEIDSKQAFQKIKTEFSERLSQQSDALKIAKEDAKTATDHARNEAKGYRSVMEAEIDRFTAAVGGQVSELTKRVEGSEEEILSRVKAASEELAARIQESQATLSARLEESHKSLSNSDSALEAIPGELEVRIHAGLSELQSEVGAARAALAKARAALEAGAADLEERLEGKIQEAVAAGTAGLADQASAASTEARLARDDVATVNSTLTAAVVGAKGDMFAAVERAADGARGAVQELKARLDTATQEAREAVERTAAAADARASDVEHDLLERARRRRRSPSSPSPSLFESYERDSVKATGVEARDAVAALRLHVDKADAALVEGVQRAAQRDQALEASITGVAGRVDDQAAALAKVEKETVPAALARLAAVRDELRAALEAGDARLEEAAAAAAAAAQQRHDSLQAAINDARVVAEGGHAEQGQSILRLIAKQGELEATVVEAQDRADDAAALAHEVSEAAKLECGAAGAAAEAARARAEELHSEALRHAGEQAHGQREHRLSLLPAAFRFRRLLSFLAFGPPTRPGADHVAVTSAEEAAAALRVEAAALEARARGYADAARDAAAAQANEEAGKLVEALRVPRQISDAVHSLHSKIQHEVEATYARREEVEAASARLAALEKAAADTASIYPTRAEMETAIEDAVERAVDDVMKHVHIASEGLAALKQTSQELGHRVGALEGFAEETRATAASKGAVEGVQDRVEALENFRSETAAAAYLTRTEGDTRYASKSTFALDADALRCRIEELEEALAALQRGAPIARLDEEAEAEAGPAPESGAAAIAAYIEAAEGSLEGYAVLEGYTETASLGSEGGSAEGGADAAEVDEAAEVAGLCGAAEETLYPL
eukprot:tig00021179_g19290.t1